MASNYLTHTVSGSVASFRTMLEEPLASCKVHFMPKQEGSGDPSPSNIRPISGWTGVNLYSAKSDYRMIPNPKVNDNLGVKWTIDENGLITAEGTPTSYSSTGICFYIDVDGTETIYCRGNGSLNNWAWNKPGLYNASGTAIATSLNDAALYNGIDLTQFSGVKRVAVNVKRSLNDTLMSGRMSVVAGKNNAPSITTTPISWTSEGTVYGGYVDFATGELVKTWWYYAFTGEEDFYNSGSSYVISYIPKVGDYAPKAANPFEGMCSHYPYAPYTTGKVGVMFGERTCVFDQRIYDATGWKQYCAEQYSAGTPLCVAYTLQDPVTYSITPQQLSSLKGINYLWSDAGDVDATYLFKDSPQMVQTRRMIGLNTPHIESTSGQVASCTTTDIYKIPSCKVNFMPKQEGSGDPSPSNVRPISGWSSISVKKSGENLFSYDASAVQTGTLANGNTRAYIPLGLSNGTFYFDAKWIGPGIINTYINIGKLSNGVLTAIDLLISSSDKGVVYPRTETFGEGEEAVLISTNETTVSITRNIPLYDIQIHRSSDVSEIQYTFPSDFGKSLNDITGWETVGNYQFCKFTDITSPVSISTEDADTTVDVSDIYFGVTKNKSYPHNPDSPGRYVISDGNIYKTAYHFINVDGYGVGEVCQYLCLYPNTADARDRLFRRFTIRIDPIYGGSIDLATGELVVEWMYSLLKANSISLNSNSLNAWTNYYINDMLPAKAMGLGTDFNYGVFDSFLGISQTGGELTTDTEKDVVWGSDVQANFRVKTRNYCSYTADEFKATFGNTHMCYRIATPIHYQLTPVSVQALKGVNNFWSDAGDVTVKYWKH